MQLCTGIPHRNNERLGHSHACRKIPKHYTLYTYTLYYCCCIQLALTRFIHGPSAASGAEGSELIRQFLGSPGGVIQVTGVAEAVTVFIKIFNFQTPARYARYGNIDSKVGPVTIYYYQVYITIIIMYGRTSSAETSSLGTAPAGNERECYGDLGWIRRVWYRQPPPPPQIKTGLTRVYMHNIMRNNSLKLSDLICRCIISSKKRFGSVFRNGTVLPWK